MAKKYVTDVFADLKCPVCWELANDPMESACCHHVFCFECAEDLHGKCAMCRKTTDFTPSIIAKRITDKFPVTCNHCSKGFTRGTIKDHEAECIPIKCPAMECDFQGNTPAFLLHLIKKHKEDVLSKVGRLFFLSKDDIIDRLHSAQNDASHTAKFWATIKNPGGKFYCEKKLEPFCECCDGVCGPVNGCNCIDCMKLDIKRLKLPKGYLVNKDGIIAKQASNDRFYCGRIVEAGNGPPGDDLRCGQNFDTICFACDVLSKQRFDRYASLI